MRAVRRSGGQTARSPRTLCLTVWPTGRLPVSALLLAAVASQSPAQSRIWHPDERTLLTDLSVVTAVAATGSVVYAAGPSGLAVFDRSFGTWRETVGPLDGLPGGEITAMAADPRDDVVWLGGVGRWMTYDPFARRLEVGALPGRVDDVELDARDPSRGAYFHSTSGWYFVARGGLSATLASDVPPPQSRIGALTYQQLVTRVPAFDAVRMRIERDDLLRTYRLTSAAVAPVTGEIYVATDGNGVFRVDPRSYATDRLPLGLLGSPTGAVGSFRGQLCAASDRRPGVVRRGITCFDERLVNFTYYEATRGRASFPGLAVRRLLVTAQAVWAATDAGLVRADRRRGELEVVQAADGLPSDDVRALAAAEGGVWAGTARGLAMVADSGRAPHVSSSLPGDPVLALLSGGDTLWVGTAAGLEVLMPGASQLLAVTGLAAMREPVVALAARGDELLAATASRFLVRSGAAWRVVNPAGGSIGAIRAVSADGSGYWVAGSQGLALFDAESDVWHALTDRADVPQPADDVATSRSYVWVATPIGVVRYEKRVLAP